MALIALVNRVFTDPMLLNIVSSFHGDFRVEVKVLSLKRDWLAHFQELVGHAESRWRTSSFGPCIGSSGFSMK